MSKLRVYELAREVKMNSSELVERLKSAGFSINNYMSSLDGDDVARAKDYLSGATSEIFEEKRIKPTIIRRRKKIVPKVEEKIEEEKPIIEEEVKPSPEEEVSLPEEKAEEVLEKEDETEVKEEPTPEQHLKVVEPKIEKKKKGRPKFFPAKIIKKAVVQPPEPKIQEPIAKIPAVDIEPLREALGKGEKGIKKKKKGETLETTEVAPKKEYRRRKKEIFERKDLYGDREHGIVGRARGRKKDKLDRKKFRQTEITVPKAIKRRIKVPDAMSVAELAKGMGVKATELIKKAKKEIFFLGHR